MSGAAHSLDLIETVAHCDMSSCTWYFRLGRLCHVPHNACALRAVPTHFSTAPHKNSWSVLLPHFTRPRDNDCSTRNTRANVGSVHVDTCGHRKHENITDWSNQQKGRRQQQYILARSTHHITLLTQTLHEQVADSTQGVMAVVSIHQR